MKKLFQFFIMSVGHFTYSGYICWGGSLKYMKQFRHLILVDSKSIYLFICLIFLILFILDSTFHVTLLECLPQFCKTSTRLKRFIGHIQSVYHYHPIFFTGMLWPHTYVNEISKLLSGCLCHGAKGLTMHT